MLVDTSERVLKLVQPRSFAGLMTLYESNYIRLRQLVGPLHALPDYLCSEVAGEPPLSLEIVERAPYTSTLRMTYWFDADSDLIADPDLVLRVYHDASMAEVLSCRNGGRHRLLSHYPCSARTEIRRRWVTNMMLHKWLEYCIDRHHFDDRPAVWRQKVAVR
ncbi:MAG TPA: DUF1249 domain-containing protein [Gammaproteobacteria bacterium]|nr:DUF1249 domain-containing protein [Gammaproteobacteria bacterium]